MTIRDLTCADVEARAADYLEGDLDAATRADVERHLAVCSDCAALVADLRAIAARARSLPPVAPTRDLWDGIAARIEAPVIGIGADTRDELARRRPLGTRGWMAIAAGLVLATAGTTFSLTRLLYDSAPAPSIAAVPSDGPAAATAGGAGGDTTLPAEPVGGSSAAAGRPAARIRQVARTAAEATYDPEIVRLRKIVDTRREQLDPATIAVIERSLAVIDAAIAQSRAALSRDPRSGFLIEQLNSALDKKIDLLRTAAMLPARS
jgi:hypothetical protein